ncbi:MAG TPA: SRPBCC family protein [Lacipirellula sp.]
MASAENYANGGFQPYPSFARQKTHATHREFRDDRELGPNVDYKERILSSLAGALLTAYGLSSGKRGSLLMAGLGGALLHRGMTGHCYLYNALGVNTAKPQPATVIPAGRGDRVEQSIVIMREPAELYSFWRELENLPKVMTHVKSIEPVDRVRSHWAADGPLGKQVEWDAEIFNDVENELIAWRSIPGSQVDTAGSVRFEPLGVGRGTKVTVNLKYDPPAGKVGAWVASILGRDPENMIADDLRRFKALLETTGATSATGQPAPSPGPQAFGDNMGHTKF